MLSAALLLALLAPPSPAPRCELRGAPWLEGAVEGTARAAVDARRGEAITVDLVAPGRLDGRPVVFAARPGRGRMSRVSAAPTPASSCGCSRPPDARTRCR